MQREQRELQSKMGCNKWNLKLCLEYLDVLYENNWSQNLIPMSKVVFQSYFQFQLTDGFT